MSEGIVGAIISALAAVLAKIGLSPKPDRLRRRLAGTLELLDKADSDKLNTVRSHLVKLAEVQSKALLDMEVQRAGRRFDYNQLVIGVAFAIPSVWGAWALWGLETWYWRVLGALLFGLGIIFVGAGISGFRNPKPRG